MNYSKIRRRVKSLEKEKPEHLPTYGMCTDVSRFYTFFDGVFHEFYPENNMVMKWFMATEEIHRYHGGKWKDFKFNVNDMENN